MPETEPTTPADIEALAVLLEAATPGPWRDVPMGSEGSVVWAGGNTITTARKPATCREFADAALIAAAVNALPALLAEVKASREARARVEALAAMYENHTRDRVVRLAPDAVAARLRAALGSAS